MNDTETLKLISGILLRSFIVSKALLVLWLVTCLAIGDFWYPIHSQLFDLTEQELKLLHFKGIGLFKILAVCFFFAPFVAIELVIRSQRKK